MKVIDTYFMNEVTGRWDRIARCLPHDCQFPTASIYNAVDEAETIQGNFAIVVSDIPDELISTLD